jgi:hypothetical protein
MDPVYLRLIVYVLSTLLAMVPASWAGFVSYDATLQVVTISLPGLITAVAGGLAVSGGIFARWGVK